MDFKSIRDEINSKNASVKEIVKEFFLKIDTIDTQINSYFCNTKNYALAQAENIDKIIQNNVIGSLFKFKKNLRHLESKNEQICLLQLLREFSYVRIERESFSYFSKLLDDVLIDYTNNNIKYNSFGVHILRELVNIRDEYCNKFTDRSSINIINL